MSGQAHPRSSYFHQLRGNPHTVRAGMRWTEEEDALLIQRAEQGMTLNDIAREHKRTTTGVRYRILAHALITARREGLLLTEVARRFHIPYEDLLMYQSEHHPPTREKKDGLETMISDIRQLLRVIVGNKENLTPS